MDRNMDYCGFPPYGFNDMYSQDNNIENNPMFNPMMQYEQSYMYYRYLTMQLEYKIKCKEYEKLYGKNDFKSERRVE